MQNSSQTVLFFPACLISGIVVFSGLRKQQVGDVTDLGKRFFHHKVEGQTETLEKQWNNHRSKSWRSHFCSKKRKKFGKTEWFLSHCPSPCHNFRG